MKTYTCIKDKIFTFQGEVSGEYDFKVGDVKIQNQLEPASNLEKRQAHQ